jgi:hypothetical protein
MKTDRRATLEKISEILKNYILPKGKNEIQRADASKLQPIADAIRRKAELDPTRLGGTIQE